VIGEAHYFRLADIVIFPDLPDYFFRDPFQIVVFLVIQFYFDV